jgi:hypothetical protein
MKVVKSTRRHKLHYSFGQFVEFPYHPKGLSEWNRWVHHFESRHGPSSEYKNLEGRKLSVLCYNNMWREERNHKQKRLRVYIREEKDLTWAQLNLA